MKKLYQFIKLTFSNLKEKLIPTLYTFVAISLLISHIMVVKGKPSSQWEMLHTASYYIALMSSFLIAMILLFSIWITDTALNIICPWRKNGLFRLALQLLIGVMLVWGLAALLVLCYFSLKGTHIAESDYWHHDALAVLEFIIIVNIAYSSRFVNTSFFRERKKRSKQQEFPEVQTSDTPRWKKQNLSPKREVLYLSVDKHVFSVTRSGEKSFKDESLIRSFESLDKEKFFMVNDKTIVHYTLIRSVEKLSPKSRRLKLILDSAICRTTIVSQARVSKCKKWLSGHGIVIKKGV